MKTSMSKKDTYSPETLREISKAVYSDETEKTSKNKGEQLEQMFQSLAKALDENPDIFK